MVRKQSASSAKAGEAVNRLETGSTHSSRTLICKVPFLLVTNYVLSMENH